MSAQRVQGRDRPPDIAAMVQARVAELAAERASRLADIPFDVRLALSLVPVWTTGLAAAAGMKRSQARETFQRLCDEGLMRHSGGPPDPLDDGDGDRYWMTASARSALLAQAQPATSLTAAVSAVADAIGGLQAEGAPVPALTRRWGELAAAPGEDGAARVLEAHVRRRLGTGESAEALRWVEAGQALEEAVGGELTVAIARAGRRIELFHRRAQDKNILAHFLARPELTAAFEQLVSGPDELWALHYVGAGGVGKTMTMRHIGAELIPGRRRLAEGIDGAAGPGLHGDQRQGLGRCARRRVSPQLLGLGSRWSSRTRPDSSPIRLPSTCCSP